VKFLADECCDGLLVSGLRQDGHDVLFVMESARGADDETVLRMAADEQRILLGIPAEPEVQVIPRRSLGTSYFGVAATGRLCSYE
jgi:hypothetical protein